ncbi:unnamed protein product [Cuscuta epithymum]|uniref:Uncharacterized protein n=1 Tax=Cuscuta epithymum TaxID=186058 RepID=A0AAV0EV66_9ASTE|nr:unnamed protein product [Cuscuta epithymum]
MVEDSADSPLIPRSCPISSPILRSCLISSLILRSCPIYENGEGFKGGQELKSYLGFLLSYEESRFIAIASTFGRWIQQVWTMFYGLPIHHPPYPDPSVQ